MKDSSLQEKRKNVFSLNFGESMLNLGNVVCKLDKSSAKIMQTRSFEKKLQALDFEFFSCF